MDLHDDSDPNGGLAGSMQMAKRKEGSLTRDLTLKFGSAEARRGRNRC